LGMAVTRRDEMAREKNTAAPEDGESRHDTGRMAGGPPELAPDESRNSIERVRRSWRRAPSPPRNIGDIGSYKGTKPEPPAGRGKIRTGKECIHDKQ